MHRTTFPVFLFFFITAYQPALAQDCPRMISQSPYISKSLQWLGLEHCIVGASRYDELELPRTGGILDPDTDMIAALEPDIMLTSRWIEQQQWQAVAPNKARAMRLGGFGSMEEVEQNLATLASLADSQTARHKASNFSRLWRRQAKKVNGGNKRVLLLSACSGTPYSFGRKRWLSDLFTAAGFRNVETVDKLRHLRKGETIEHVTGLIKQFKPELIFIFQRKTNQQCAAIPPSSNVHIINLDGEHFLHPAPVLLKGIDDLIRQKHLWSTS